MLLLIHHSTFAKGGGQRLLPCGVIIGCIIVWCVMPVVGFVISPMWKFQELFHGLLQESFHELTHLGLQDSLGHC